MSFESSVPVDAPSPAERRATQPLRLNNISELRLVFAACVVLSHTVQLAAAHQFDVIRVVMNSEVAVQGFFILSGYLVFGSYDRIRDPATFYIRRFLRIYPAYFVAVLLFLALALVQTALLGRGIAWDEVGPYLAANLATLNFLQPTIGGVFAGNLAQAINGALWSIKVEMMFYAAVPLLFGATRYVPMVVLALALVAFGVAWWPALSFLGEAWGGAVPESLRNQLPGQLHFFGLGVALFALSKGILRPAGLVAIVLFALVSLVAVGDAKAAAHALGLVTVIGVVSAMPKLNTIFARTDVSYGVYLCHFPIIQMLLASGAASWPFWLYLAAIVAPVAVYGIASWVLIERPALAFSRRSRA